MKGLVTELPCDSASAEGWFLQENIGTVTLADDAADKKEGAASQKLSGQSPDPAHPEANWFARVAKLNVSMSNGNRLHIYHKSDDTNHSWKLDIQSPNNSLFYNLLDPASAVEGWTLKKLTIPSVLGNYNYAAQFRSTLAFSGAYGSAFRDSIDRLIVSTTRYLTVTGLVPGQKVEFYRASDNTLVATLTVAGGASQVVFDIDAEEYPAYYYLKVYASDGTTLVETTSNQRMSGGDTWYWVSPAGTLTATSTAFIIERQAAVGTGTPKQATVTVTLKTGAGAPAPSKTINFSTGLGSVNPASAVTDANGRASTVLTSTVHGIAVVKCSWPGDSAVPAAINWVQHHVFWDAEVADSTKNFQFFVEGVALSFVDGQYILSSENTPQEFRVEVPDWLSTIIPRGLVSIYRLGVKEYGGVLTKIDRVMSESPRVVLSGTDSKALLETRVVTLSDYSGKTLSFILSDLISAYPSGITLGVVGDYPTSLTFTFTDESLVSSISRICNAIGWLYRVNPNLTLDVKTAFGTTKAATIFAQGTRLFLASSGQDYTQLSNSIRMRGATTLASTQFDSSSIETIGILEEVAFEKGISVQATLDLAASAELARKTGATLKILAEILDDYAAGSWGIDDWVTITSDEVNLSGVFKVVKITRHMNNPQYGQLEATNKAQVDLGDLFERLRREIKDLAKNTI